MRHIVLLLFFIPLLSFSHSGNTDRYGGHNDNINGGYHYHHGKPAHSHSGGCPYESRPNFFWDNFLWFFIGGFAIFIFVVYLLGVIGRQREKQRKIEKERSELANRHESYLYLKRKQYNQNDEYISNQLSADQALKFNELKDEFEPKPKVNQKIEEVKNETKGAYRVEYVNGELKRYTRVESFLMDLDDFWYSRWIFRRIKSKRSKIILAILLSPLYYLGFAIIICLIVTLFVGSIGWIFTTMAGFISSLDL